MNHKHVPADTATASEPLLVIEHGGHRLTLLGTAHISRASMEKVQELLANGSYDAVAVELCPSRYNAIVNPDALARMDLFQVFREKKATLVTASLALGAYQQRMAEQLGVTPGAEMHAAITGAQARHLPVLLIDREVAVTLKRIYRGVPWWQRFGLIAGLLGSVTSRRSISEEEIERLKQGDMLESIFTQFAEEAQALYVPLIDERDRYMSLRLAAEIDANDYRDVLVVIGAGHLRGLRQHLDADLSADNGREARLAELDRVPPPSRLPRILSWVVIVLILAGFALGFLRNPQLGMQMVVDWVLINGGLAALGATIAGGHYLTIASAFAAAPLTSFNPVVGAGMIAALVETALRKPEVGDFSRLRQDTRQFRGWWRNRVSRTLLVFLCASLGSAAGTYIAGFLIFRRLAGAE